MRFLNGNKTNLGLVLGGLCGILWTQGIISDQIAQTAAMAISAWTGIAVRHAYSKSNPKSATATTAVKSKK